MKESFPLHSYPSILSTYTEQRRLTPQLAQLLNVFYKSYMEAMGASKEKQKKGNENFTLFTELVVKHLETKESFGLFHKSLRHPFDYYAFGLDFIRPLIDFSKSRVFRPEIVETMVDQLARGENVILLANHQTEPDPQIISLLLEKEHPTFASELIFVAGHRVVTDPLAIPMSLGCNLLCIYSKKHIDHPPEEKPYKVSHNQRTMKKMGELLSKGGVCIYVAPSGGRDRPDAEGNLSVAPFDPHNIEMFWLIAQQASQPVHFYPLALSTYSLLPPPNHVEREIGEKRQAQHVPVHLAFGKELDMELFSKDERFDKKEKRQKRADYIWKLVSDDYKMISNLQ